jgi:hypothetical protein
VILRGLLLLAGAVALAGSIAVDRPERFAITAPCGLLAIVVAAGAIAADAVPLRRVPLACSAATLVLGVVLVVARGEIQIPVAAAIVLLQGAALAPQARGGAPRITRPR